MSSARSARAERTRGKIIRGAMSCFGALGVQDASMDLIAAQAGVTKPTLYAHFGSKDGLLDAVITTLLDEVEARVFPPFDPTRPVEAQLVEIVGAFFDEAFHEDQLALVRALMLEQARRVQSGAPIAAYDGREGKLVAWFTSARDAGALAITDPHEANELLWALLKGALFWPALMGFAPIPSPAIRAAQIQRAVSVFLRGVLSP